MIGATRHCILHSFSDASFAPYKFNGRKGITGWCGFSAKVDLCDPLHANNSQFHFRLAKPSSMHCKLYLKKVWLSANSVRGSMLVWERCKPKSVPKILLESDSSSALQLLVGQDIPKRSRHVEIRLAWMKSKMAFWRTRDRAPSRD